ncbi:MAG: N-6 DNA methylase [Chloroflexota bacterium]|nr:N-6 DNA methylase [Chloroflexota bacterium]
MLEQVSAEKRKEAGIHYTPTRLADFVAEQILAGTTLPSSKKLRVMDPAVGNGQLLLSLAEHLLAVGTSDFEVSGFDTSSIAIESASSRLEANFPTIKLELACDDFLEFVLTNYAPNGQYSLFASAPPEPCDLVIANPPYVRTQVMGQTNCTKTEV